MSERESILPKDEAEWLQLRKPNINSTEISSLFNASPYATKAELFYNKRNGDDLLPFEENDRTRWGKRLQNSIAYGIGEDQGWKVTPFPNYIRIKESRMGSSFDFIAETPEGLANFEIKNVDGLAFKNGWIETDFGLEAPEHIEVQTQAQMHVGEFKLTYIGALIGGNRVVLLRRDYDPIVGKSLEAACRKFWDDIKNNRAPEFDFVRDYDLIRAVYNTAADGKIISATEAMENAMRRQKEAQKAESEAGKLKEAANAELLALAGDAQKVVGQRFNASLSVTERGAYEVKATKFRTVRVSEVKAKERVA